MNNEIVVFQVLLLKGAQVLVSVVMAVCKTQLKEKNPKYPKPYTPRKIQTCSIINIFKN